MIDKAARIGRLYDVYSALLTDRQRRWVELHYFDDLSLAEIAEQHGVTRQAVHDNVRRAEEQLESYDALLGLIRLQEQRNRAIEALLAEWQEVMDLLPKERSGRIKTLLDELSVNG